MKNNNKGFSLIELSIVLIIMGLLVAGAVKGYSLYMSAKVLRLNNELTKYAFASEQFTATYGNYPGILANAKEQLGDKAKLKLDSNKTNPSMINEKGDIGNAESINFFNHLYVAGLLDEGEVYEGTDADVSTDNITPDSGYYPVLRSFPDLFPYVKGDDVSGYYNGVNRLVLASYKTKTAGVDIDVLLSLDSKFDDGLPLGGSMALMPDTSFGGN